MSGALAQLLGEALGSLGHAVESTSEERMEPRALLAIAERVKRALAASGVASGEPVHVRIGNRPSDLGALLGIWRAGAVAVPVHVAAAAATIERLQRRTGARFLVDGERLETIAPDDEARISRPLDPDVDTTMRRPRASRRSGPDDRAGPGRSE